MAGSDVLEAVDRLRSIAILDDDVDFCEALAGGIDVLGYPTARFSVSEALFAYLADSDPLCLLLDYNLPGTSGLQVQARLQTSNPGLPIVFITACADRKVAQRAMSAGARAFLSKPVRLADLERLIGDLGNRALPG